MLVIGKGSNLLAMDGELPSYWFGRPLMINRKLSVKPEKSFCLKSEADAIYRVFLILFKEWPERIEGLCGIPASVGGAIAMNAGSFGTDTFQNLEQITVATKNGFFDFKSQLKPSYRRLEIPQIGSGWIVTNSIFGLTRRPKDGIFQGNASQLFEKKSKQIQLLRIRLAVCLKNPSSQIPAGKLLDMAGFRGKRHGGVFIFWQTCKFSGKRRQWKRGSSFWRLIREAQNVVWHKFGYQLDLR